VLLVAHSRETQRAGVPDPAAARFDFPGRALESEERDFALVLCSVGEVGEFAVVEPQARGAFVR